MINNPINQWEKQLIEKKNFGITCFPLTTFDVICIVICKHSQLPTSALSLNCPPSPDLFRPFLSWVLTIPLPLLSHSTPADSREANSFTRLPVFMSSETPGVMLFSPPLARLFSIKVGTVGLYLRSSASSYSSLMCNFQYSRTSSF